MLVTIISDGSWCQSSKSGGYGIWIVSNRGKLEIGGELNGYKSSTIVEVLAVANGLYHGIEKGIIYKSDHIVFQTDCVAAIHLFTKCRKPKGVEVDVYNWFFETLHHNELSFKMRHIKGHSNKKDSRSLAQKKCDELAGRYMLAGRNKNGYIKPVEIVKSEKNDIDKQLDWVKRLKLLIKQNTKVTV